MTFFSKLILMRRPAQRRTASRWICSASSLVGASTRARTPLFCGAPSLDKTGMRNAAVLPDPVGADASRSRPPSMTGMACIWMGVGSFHVDCSMLLMITALRSPGTIFISANVAAGEGTWPPFTLICIRFRNALTSSSLRKRFAAVGCAWPSPPPSSS